MFSKRNWYPRKFPSWTKNLLELLERYWYFSTLNYTKQSQAAEDTDPLVIIVANPCFLSS